MHRMRLMLLLLGLTLLPIAAQAATADLCFTTQFIDFIRISGVTETDNNPATFSLNWVEEAPTLYRLKGPSVVTPSFPVETTYAFTVYSDNITEFFAGNPTCRTRANLTPPPTPTALWTGAATLLCTDGPGVPFSTPLTLTEQRPCLSPSVLAARTQRLQAQGTSAAGESQNNEWRP